jgi:hypothetical protein
VQTAARAWESDAFGAADVDEFCRYSFQSARPVLSL